MEMNKENGILEAKKTACDNVHEEMCAYASEQDEFVSSEACGEQAAEEPVPEVKQTEIRMDESTLFIAPVGRLDTVTSAELKDMISLRDWKGRDAELDFTDVEYISSAGLRLLVSLQKQAKADGHTMVIKNINAVVREVFRISGFNKAFTVL